MNSPICKVCGGPVTKFIRSRQAFWDWCSASCMGRDPQVLARKQQTSLKKYGVPHAIQSPEIQRQRKQTCLNNWGVDNPSKSPLIQEQIRERCQELWGVDNPSKSPLIQAQLREQALTRYENNRSEILDKRSQTLLDTYGVSHNSQIHISPHTISKYNDLDWIQHQHLVLQKSCHQIAQELGVSDTVILNRLKLAGVQPVRRGVSEAELQLRAFVSEHYTGTLLFNDRTIIAPQELDIVLPDLKLALEFQGVFWHSEQRGRDRKYHVGKTQACEKQGYQLIQIYDTEWQNPRLRSIVESRLRHHLGLSQRIPARQCEIQVLSPRVARDFVNDNHLQGSCGCQHAQGLYWNNQLVAVLTVGKSRFNSQIPWELLRYCVLKNHTVVGGMARLLKSVTTRLNISELISYADRRWSSSQRNVYASTGFQLQGVSDPNYKYFHIKNSEIVLESRNKYQKHRLAAVLVQFDPSLTEFENMSLNDYFRIWDCGNLVYTWRPCA